MAPTRKAGPGPFYYLIAFACLAVMLYLLLVIFGCPTGRIR